MRAFAVVCIASLLRALTTPATADDVPDAATLRARTVAAAGAADRTYRQTLAISGTEGDGQRVVYQRGDDRREIEDIGSLHTESGTYHGDRWHENANGHVVIDEPDPGLATGETFVTRVVRVNAPIDAYVISELNAKGFGSREFIDPATSLVVRREHLTPNGKITTVYSEFRTFGARRLATRVSVRDETSSTDTRYVTSDYVAGDVSETDVAVPAIKRALVEYPAGVNRVVLPSRFEPHGHVVVRLTIAGRGLDFLLDTGAGSITLDPGVAHALGLVVMAKSQSSSNAGRFATGYAKVPLLAIGDLQMRDTIVSIVPWAAEEPGVKSVGLLGFDFLCESGITIDYEHQTVTAERYGTYAAPHGPRVISLLTRLGAQVPMVTADINGAVSERIMIDTGAAGPFLLFDYFSRRHAEALPQSNVTSQPIVFEGAGGRFETRSIELASFTVGNVAFKRFDGFLVTSASAYSYAADGVIGPDFLRYFDLHLDYPNGTIYLVPNATGARAMH